jgi:16S rRNA (guanine527-N7)-methyltransferase
VRTKFPIRGEIPSFSAEVSRLVGFFFCQKGPEVDDEIKEAEKAIKELGGELVDVKQYQLPFSDVTHNIVIIKKVVHTPTKYPRKPGKPSSSPIK